MAVIMKIMNVIELFCQGKSDTRVNEDGYLITSDFVAVVDGATSKNGRTHEGLTGGAKLKNIILDTVSRFQVDISMEMAVKSIQSNILSGASVEIFGSSAASALIYSRAREEVWSVGDCRMMVDGKAYYFEKEIDKKMALLRRDAIKRYLACGYSVDDLRENDLARKEILPLLRKQSNLENSRSEYGYCVFNNTTPVSEFPVDMVGVIKVDEAQTLILASDGYPELKPTLEKSECRLMEIINQDPLCYSIYPSTKGLMKGNSSFDDRTYIRMNRGDRSH